MDRNTVIGLSLIFILFILWQQLVSPSPKQIAAEKRREDSLAQVERLADSLAKIKELEFKKEINSPSAQVPDSVKLKKLSATFGGFAAAARGKEENFTLENEVVKVTFSNKGGRIRNVLLKKYYKMLQDDKRQDYQAPLSLLEDANNRFEYFLPVVGVAEPIRSSNLYFTATKKDNSIVFRADAGNGQYFEQQYALSPNSYQIDYDIQLKGLDKVLQPGAKSITLNWLDYLDRIEKATTYERTLATINFKAVDENSKQCSPTKEYVEKDADGKPLEWVSNINQFFNSTLMAEETPFASGKMNVTALSPENENLKQNHTLLKIPIKGGKDDQFAMHFYIGPNKFENLRAMGHNLQDIVPFGNNILGTINRWVIRPIFTWLSWLIGSKGIVILMLTLIVKLLLYPLTYRMIYSQTKMTALKPEMEKMKEKYADDPQKQQAETMKVYREFGVNPLGACLPMFIQMPIWIALYRFFPASIEFRQATFWWSNDLSSYDEFFQLPFSIPFGFGDHLSLFALLWTLSTLAYTWYNSKNMDFSAQPGMQYLQYIMPVMFMGFFNSSAAGLSAYMFFSNLLNIGQTLVTKTLIIDEAKVKAQLEANRKKPKKKGGFGERFENLLNEQQKVQQQREAEAKKKKK